MATHEKYEANKILVLDDEKLIRLAVCARLKRAGYESVAVGTVDEAVKILINNAMSDHGRGRLMVRQLCEGIQRQRYGNLYETTFYIPWNVATKEENA